MQPLDYIKLCLTQKYSDFDGRARRSEFWWLFLFLVILNMVGEGIEMVVGYEYVGWILSLATLIPTLAAGARRLHDIGKSGWWQLLYLTLIGFLVLVFWWIQDSTPGSNEYGPNPKTDESDVADHLV